ncbi:MAG: DinB family protein [Acidobacteria bacterium]|nr:DinB family protein [Acidobacteriota bacterium]
MVATSPLALSPEIDAFRRQFEQLALDADALVAPLSDRQFHWQPRPDAWSVAQCIDHLNVTARLYLPMLDEGVADAIRRGMYNAGPYTYNWIGRFLVYLVAPSTRVRARAPKPFQPAAGRPRHDVMAAFRAYQVQYIDRLRQANGLDLARARVSSPLARWIRMPLGSGFAMMVAHEQRHLAQARRVREAAGFPK